MDNENELPKVGEHTSVVTESGSVYVIRELNGLFFLSGRNVVTPESTALPTEEQAIDRPTPWPPVVGQEMFFGTMRPEDGMIRVKGKRTSPVKEVRSWGPSTRAVDTLLESIPKPGGEA